MKLGFVFRSHPHSSSKGREGLDAILAASAYSEDIAVFFIGEGVTQLIASQDPSQIYSRDYAPAFKLMALYDIEEVYVCEDSLLENGVKDVALVIDVNYANREAIKKKLSQCDKLLTF